MSALAAAAAGVGAITSLIGTNQTNKTNIKLQREQNEWNAAQAEKANKWNLEQWERENVYNNAQNQMARLEAAGLNPNLMYGQGSPGSAGSVKSEVAPSVAPARVTSPLQNFSQQVAPMISMYQDLQNKQAQLSVQQKQAQLIDQEIASKALDNVSKGYRNTRESEELPFYQMNAMADAQRKRLTYENMNVEGRIKQLNENILLQSMPSMIERSQWITRDVKQRALGGELNNELNRSLKPFGVTQNDELWQRYLIPTVNKLLMKWLGTDKTVHNNKY